MAKSIYSTELKAMLKLLRHKREKSGITQIEVAMRLGMTQSAVSKVERGERRLDVVELRRWCKGIGVSFVAFVRELDRTLSK